MRNCRSRHSTIVLFIRRYDVRRLKPHSGSGAFYFMDASLKKQAHDCRQARNRLPSSSTSLTWERSPETGLLIPSGYTHCFRVGRRPPRVGASAEALPTIRFIGS